MPQHTKWMVVAGLAAIAAIWLGGGFWRLGEPYWRFRLTANPFGDEGIEWIYIQVGCHGGPEAYSFLSASLETLLASGGNDVELAGIVDGMVCTADKRVREDLLKLFQRYESGPAAKGRYVAIHAAKGLQSLHGEAFTEAIPLGSAYRKFGVSNFASSPDEQRAADERFWRLSREIAGRFGDSSEDE